jgi:hypothetical protein
VRSSCCSRAKIAKADQRGDPVRKRFPGLRDASLFSYAIEMNPCSAKTPSQLISLDFGVS